MNRLYYLSNLLISTLLCMAGVSAVQSDEKVDFARDVRPILAKNCFGCHGAEKQKSSLRLDIKSLAFKGGSGHGPAIVSGKAQESPLFELASSTDADEKMPPKGPGLSPAELKKLERWINAGAAWPDGIDTAKVADTLDHWAFKPLSSATPPDLKTKGWDKIPIDRFICEGLLKSGLSPSAEASRRTWLRRVSLDLTGLLPTMADVETFENDTSRDAYDKVVDRLLASPRYGERWGQHWLDVVRYADTHGFEVNTERP
ncbi:MAG: DUF1549 domain-containing protein, partial [Isosphaeraceae bacterium]